MPVSRMRMRPWLEMQIDSNQIPGLIWINKVSLLCTIIIIIGTIFVSITFLVLK